MTNTSTRLRILAAIVLISVAALYCTHLTTMGMYSTDEPRYADIGRTMARTGDWITPKLWGEPWFEKPPLIYWMTAGGFLLGLSDDLAPRFPMAVLSVAFLVFFWCRLSYLFDERVAVWAAAILATTGGWLAYSHVDVADVPVSIFFTVAVLLSLARDGDSPRRTAAAVALGLAVLAKSIPPLVLFLPILIADRTQWRRWFLSWPIVAFALVALPWHVIATLRNGWNLPYVLFIEQQFGRFVNTERMHGQPWWFYVPVFLLLLFPWFPLLPLAIQNFRRDSRTRLLAIIVAVGMVFFSAAINKLPGYVLPLIPVTCILLAHGLSSASNCARWLIAPIALIGALPLAAAILPIAAGQGLGKAWATQIPWSTGIIGIVVATLVGAIVAFALQPRVFVAAFLLVTAGYFWLEVNLFPPLDKAASARSLWRETRPECSPVPPRPLGYGLYYYSGKMLPSCAIVDKNAAPANGSSETHH